MRRLARGHPLFARFYACMSSRADALGVAGHREELLSGLSGRGLEIGAGNGRNFAHYPEGVTEVLAVEPEPYLRARAVEAARLAGVPVAVVDASAESVPAADGSFDFAVASLVLCSVPDQAEALSEVRRVVRPGGELRFYEHVRSGSGTLARLQSFVTPLWRVLGAGCHPDRSTVSAIEDAGFVIEQVRAFSFKPGPRFACALVAPHVIGRARRR